MNGIVVPKTIDDYKELGFFAPKINYGKKEIYLSEKGVEALRRICRIVYDSGLFKGLLNYNDIYQGVSSELGAWLERALIPEGDEYIAPLSERLSKEIKAQVFICRVDGINRKNINSISVGNRTIANFSEELIEGISGNNEFTQKIIDEQYEGSLVILGSERGSDEVALEKFYRNSELSLSVLRLYSCSHYSYAIKRTNIRLINNCSHAHGPASCLHWGEVTKEMGVTSYFISEQELKLSPELLAHLVDECFFEEISGLIDKKSRTELEQSILRSLYWLGEAQKDSSNASSWVKLWSCLECFFTLGEDEITERNARGISSIILYGGYHHKEYQDYDELKKIIKNYYALRSKIVHRAEHRHIDDGLLMKFSYLVAWVIITMTALSVKGYTHLKQVREKADLADKACLNE